MASCLLNQMQDYLFHFKCQRTKVLFCSYIYNDFVTINCLFQICANGLVSFDKGFMQPKPSMGHESLQKEYIISPFFASVDMQSQNAGTVFYRVLDLHHNHSAMTSTTVKQLEQLVKYSSNVPNDFTTSTMMVVTWDKVLPRQRTISATTVHAQLMLYVVLTSDVNLFCSEHN